MTKDDAGQGDLHRQWGEVGERFGEVGRRLSERYRSSAADAPAPGSKEDRKALEDAVRKVTSQLDQVFTSVGDALRDPDERERMGTAVRSLGTAITATFDQALRGLRPPRRDDDDPAGASG